MTTEAEQVFAEILGLEMLSNQARRPYSFMYDDIKDGVTKMTSKVVVEAIAAEREACARICSDIRESASNTSTRLYLAAAEDAIRARGKEKK